MKTNTFLAFMAVAALILGGVAVAMYFGWIDDTTDKVHTRIDFVTQNTTLNLYAVGQTSHQQNITHLQYLIYAIKACQSVNMTGQGHAFNNEHNCWTFYQSPTTKNRLTYRPDVAANDTSDEWTDFGNITARNSLDTVTTVETSRTFRFIVVEYFRTVRVQASFATVQGWIAYSTPAVNYTLCPDLSNTSCCANGNTDKRFFVLTEEEEENSSEESVAEEAELTVVYKDTNAAAYPIHFDWIPDPMENYTIALGYNLKHLLKLKPTEDECGHLTDTAGNQLVVPFLPFAPVIYDGRNTSSHAMKESYYIYAPNPLNITYRLELYYLASDVNKTIHSTDLRTIFHVNTTGEPREADVITTVVRNEPAEEEDPVLYDFFRYDGKVLISGLRRSSGTPTTAKVQCLWCAAVANLTSNVFFMSASAVQQ